ncbi:MAG TPA: hypothetical protein VGM21_15560 [Actinomycetota bacterium]|jgi:hypothetical protein
MNLLGILTLVAVGLIVVALAASLLTILVQLRRILGTLRVVGAGLGLIAERVQPLEPILAEVNADLTVARDGLLGVLRGVQDRPEQERV